MTHQEPRVKNRPFKLKTTTIRPRRVVLAAFVLLAAANGFVACRAAEPPAPPPTSSYAPAEELLGLVEEYVEKLRGSLRDEESFQSGQPRLKKEASTLACFAVALGLHDMDNRLKGSAAMLLAGAQQLAAAENLESSRAAMSQIESALGGNSASPAELSWNKVASLEQLMKQVTFLNARLKRAARGGPRFASSAEEAAGYATTLAVIAQAITADTHEVKDAADIPKWFEYCAQMRDTAGEAASALRARNAEAAQMALARMEQSCNACHKTFRVETTE
jgi:cytochrome c556